MPRLAVPRLDIVTAPIPAVNVLALRTLEDRNLLIITDGAIRRLGFRHLQALVVQGLVRLSMPEARAWSTAAILFGAIHQIQLGKRVFETVPKDVGLVRARHVGIVLAAVGWFARILHDPEIDFRADHAVEGPRNPNRRRPRRKKEGPSRARQPARRSVAPNSLRLAPHQA